MDELDRLFQRLVHNIRTKDPAHLVLPFTVAELYEQIVPYRHNRRELGIETNSDYEVAVTRLLAGERGFLLGDASMQEALRKDAESAEPGVFRDFAAAEVTISPGALQRLGVQSPPSPRSKVDATAKTPSARKTPARAPGGKFVAAAKAGGVTPVRQAAPTPPAPATVSPRLDEAPAVEGCRYCGVTLPGGREVKFCPNCGQNLTVSRCPACGSELESGWRFCVTCGRPSGG